MIEKSKNLAWIGLVRAGLLVCSSVVLTACLATQRAPVVEDATAAPPTPVPTPQAVQTLGKLNALEAELQSLRNTLEQQQFELDNLKQRQQDLYQSADQRLQQIESTSRSNGGYAVKNPGLSDAVGSQGGYQQPDAQVGGQIGVEAPLDGAIVPGGGSPTTASVVPSGSGPITIDQQGLYDQGFDLLKESRYQDAIGSFQQLVDAYPDSTLADDSLYWIGEANFVNRQYESAINAFEQVAMRYPSSDRVPEAMLKVGYVQYDMGAYDEAKVTFTEVVSRYSDHPVAISAKSRLQRLERGISN